MSATISACGTYRYDLSRNLGASDKMPTALFVMLNPSTAGADVDDPTIRRCVGFARREGLDRVEVVNLYAYRATHPKDLRSAAKAGVDVYGPANELYVRQALWRRLRCPDLVIAAWGAHADPHAVEQFARHVSGVSASIAACGLGATCCNVWCLGKTKAGQPRHPLMLRADTPLELWEDWR